jgi:hypothetical protein
MRKSEAKGWMLGGSSRTARRALQLSAITLGVGLLLASGAARAGDDDGDDKTFEEKIIEGIMRGMGATNMDNGGIDYRERSPLVVPPKLDLPPPASASAEVKVPNWPKDPDVQRHKEEVARRKKENKDPVEASRVLSPSELNVAKTAPSGGNNHTSESEQPGGDPGASAVLSPSQLGFDGRLSSFFGGSKNESKEFKAEPPRETLTEPPPGYQTPSPNFAYGTGPKESMNKEYNPAAGKYGE